VPRLHEHHLFVLVPCSVGSVGAGDAPRPRGGWLDTPACPTAPATVLHNGGGTLLRPFAAALGSPQTLTTWSRPSRCRAIAAIFPYLFSTSAFSPLPFRFPSPFRPSGPFLALRFLASRRFLQYGGYTGISGRSVAARRATRTRGGGEETPAIRTGEHRNDVQASVTARSARYPFRFALVVVASTFPFAVFFAAFHRSTASRLSSLAGAH